MRLIYTLNSPARLPPNKKQGDAVEVGDALSLGDGEKVVVTDIVPPHSPASTGRVYVATPGTDHGHGYFPSVVGAEWVDREDRD